MLTIRRQIPALLAAALLLAAFAARPAYAADTIGTPIGINLDPAFVAKILSILAALAIVLPHLQAILQKPWASPRVKAIGSVILSILGGIVGFVITDGGGLDWSDPVKIAIWFAGVYTTSTTLYARLFKPAGTTDYLEHHINGEGRIAPTDYDIPGDVDDELDAEEAPKG